MHKPLPILLLYFSFYKNEYFLFYLYQYLQHNDCELQYHLNVKLEFLDERNL